MNNNFNNFNNMDDLFNQLMGGMRGYSSENRRYLINGREVTPEEFAHYRATGQLPGNAEVDGQMQQQPSGMKQDGVLAKLGRNLTAEAREGKLDPVIGRNKEIQETSEILSRRTKNNPVLVGDAGVGKTAVVEGLAQAIVNGDVPAAIKNKEIISIDISGLEAGTQYRGSFEENIQNLVNEVKEAGNIILFFDEIHQILGAGSTGGDSGSKGLADILKPALSRGELTVIGATTQDEYRNTILKNAALARRFNEVKVNAPVEREIEAEKDKQEKAVEAEDFEAALNYKTRIAELEKKIENHTEDMKVTASVNDVAESVERMTGIPVSQMGASDIERLKDMAHRLQDKVIGQDKAVEAVARAIRRNRAGFDEGNRPIGSFLFVGPTGVGKTELAKQLALDMFGTKDAIIRLDMSEYSDRTAVSKLIGTTAGYVGYDDNSNTLTERVRRNPYSIILLDEIEKADPQVITLLLQVLDDGRLTDGQGNTVNFKNTVIIATSNAGFGYEANLTEDADKPELMDRLKPFFRPEFLNRFNAVIEFSHLNKEDLSKIVDLMLAEVNQTLAKKDINLEVSQAAKDFITEEGYDEVMGVRPLRRVVEQQIRDKVTDFHLDHLDAKHLEADMEDGVLVIREKA